MICDYHEYISKLSLESELDLLKYCNINMLTSILTQNKLKYTSCYKTGKLAKKLWQIGSDSPKIFAIKGFLPYIQGYMNTQYRWGNWNCELDEEDHNTFVVVFIMTEYIVGYIFKAITYHHLLLKICTCSTIEGVLQLKLITKIRLFVLCTTI